MTQEATVQFQSGTHINPRMIEVVGVVDTITFANEETGYGVIRVRVGPEHKAANYVSKKGVATIVGTVALARVGENIRVVGTVVTDPKYGSQIKVDTFTLTEPRGFSDLVGYLADRVDYIDKITARSIVSKFGADTVSIIDNTPERLKEVPGIGEKRYKAIIDSWAEQREYRNLLMFASSIGISTSVIKKIYTKHGDRTVEVVKADPYRLAREVDGVGFKKADEIARHLGVHELDPRRLLAAVEHVILEMSQQKGDCFQYAIELVDEATNLLANPQITHETVRFALMDGIKQEKLVNDGDKIYLPHHRRAEILVAEKLTELMANPMPACLKGEFLTKAIATAFDTFGFTPADRQREAVTMCLSNKVSIVTGGPGVGKTACTKSIVYAFESVGLQVTLMAPTGRAAKRMTEVIGRQATTIHRRVMKMGPESPSPLTGVVIVDEMSMTDIVLMKWIMDLVTPATIVVFVGDKDQLPSVGAGAVLRDLLECQVIPLVHLNQIFRQSADSYISMTAAKINEGVMPEKLIYFGSCHPFVKSDMYTIMQEDADKQASAVLWCATEMAKSFGFDPLRDCQVMAPMRKGEVGVENLNTQLQLLLNPHPETFVTRGDIRWGTGDKMMQVKNNYDLGVMNGDVGVITAITKKDNRLDTLEIDFDGRLVKYSKDDVGNLVLAYVSTVHKCQGAESPMIVMPLHTSHTIMLQRNLLYTGITRGKKLVVLICNDRALSMAIRNNRVSRRNTFLAERIREAKVLAA